MIAPVYAQNAKGRYVYLPEPMKLVRLKGMGQIEEEALGQGHYYIEVPLDEVVFFIRPEKIVPYTEPGQYMEEVQGKEIKLLHFASKEAEYELYQDDGYGKDYGNPAHITKLRVEGHTIEMA